MPASRLAQASDHSFFDITPTGYVRSAGTSPSLALGIRGGPLCLDTIRHRVGATPTARQRNPDRASAQPSDRMSLHGGPTLLRSRGCAPKHRSLD